MFHNKQELRPVSVISAWNDSLRSRRSKGKKEGNTISVDFMLMIYHGEP